MAGTIGLVPTTRRKTPSGARLLMAMILRSPSAAARPVASAKTEASSGMVVSMVAEAMIRPAAVLGVTSP